MIDPQSPDRLVCDRSNHVPGCEHLTPPDGQAIVTAFAPLVRAVEAPDPTIDPDPPGLTMTIEVTISRVGRKRCPRCRRLRVLYRLTGYGADQPVGYGVSRCLGCAALRVEKGP